MTKGALEDEKTLTAKILLVDDRKENLHALESLLSDKDVEILKANSGREALEFLLVHEFALALLDVQMPDINGFELAELMRGSENSRTVPIIFVTAGAIDQKHTFQGYEAGAVDFLYKPLDPRVVRSKVQIFLELDRQRKLLNLKLEEMNRAKDQLADLAQRLSDQQKWLQSVLDLMPVPLELFCQETKQVMFSNQAANLLMGGRDERGYLQEGWYYCDINGKPLHEGDRPDAIVANGKQLASYEVLFKTPEKMIPLVFESDTLPAKFGHPSTSVIAFQDLTKIKTVEAELKQAKEVAEAASSSKSAFLANMSHEIRTPLGAILGFAELLNEQKVSKVQKEKYVGIILKNGQNLSRLIDDILDLAKVEAGKLETEKTRFSLRELMNDVITLLSIRAQEKGLTLEVRSRGKMPEVIESDQLRLRQILLNIIGNAIKFTESGGVTIQSECVDLGHGKGCKIIFEVKDTGVGITSAQRDVLFQSFSQADSSTTRKFGGTGLGLILSRRLATLLGGNVYLLPEPEELGSTFVIEIESSHADFSPLPASSSAAIVRSDDAGKLESVKVLVVDDSPDNQVLLNLFLSKEGALTEFANNGQEGVDKALNSDFDLVLMDIQMPVMDGHKATKELRQRGFVKPIVALSAHAMKEDRDKSLEVGCNEHLIKPINRTQLIETVARLSH